MHLQNHEKIKYLRTYLNMTQTEFGKRLGVSIDVIKNLEYNRARFSDLLLNHMFDVYHVNREWWETGEGEPVEPATASEYDEIISQLKTKPAIRSILNCWARMNDEQQQFLENYVEDILADYQRQLADAEADKLRETAEKLADSIELQSDNQEIS